jgi:tyrosyl-tRNA synthetase
MDTSSKLSEKLQERGLLKKATSERLPEPLCIYLGFDPTATSLHIGSLIPLQILRIAKIYGHKTIALIGSGTALVGDPTWKNRTRPILSQEEINLNAKKIKKQIQRIANPDLFVDNSEWLNLGLLQFLRETGAHFSVNQLINLETFSKRLENEEHLSFLELSYPLLQAYDFLHLHQKYGCNLQVGGSDQWGNITQGVNYVNRMIEGEVYGLTANLLLTSNGEKMGKSGEGTIFLDPELTKPYDFWQFWRNVEDDEVQDFLIQLTEMSIVEIKDLLGDLNNAKKVLADKLTSTIHSPEVAAEVRKMSESIFERGDYHLLPITLVDYSLNLDKIVFELGLNNSISEAKRSIQNGAVQLDGIRAMDPNVKLHKEEHMLCYGKHKYFRLKAK